MPTLLHVQLAKKSSSTPRRPLSATRRRNRKRKRNRGFSLYADHHSRIYERGPSSCIIFCIPLQRITKCSYIALLGDWNLTLVMKCLQAFVMVPSDPCHPVPATSCRPPVTFPSETSDVCCPGAPGMCVLQTLYASAGCNQSRSLHLPASWSVPLC